MTSSRELVERRWPAPGDKMKFLARNGYDHELEKAKTVFTEGQIVTVKDIDVGSWSHSIAFEGVEGRWNGVMFERVIEALSQPHAGVEEAVEAARKEFARYGWGYREGDIRRAILAAWPHLSGKAGASEAKSRALDVFAELADLTPDELETVVYSLPKDGRDSLRRILAGKAGAEAGAVAVKPLDDDQIMGVIREVAPWKTEPALNDLLTYEKSPPLFPQATYDVPSYRAEKLVRAIEARILAALSPAAVAPGVGELREVETNHLLKGRRRSPAYFPATGEICEVSGPNCDDANGYTWGQTRVLWQNKTFVLYGSDGFWPVLHKHEHVLFRPVASASPAQEGKR